MTSEMTRDHDWYSSATATFGDRLADARETLGMSVEDLAARLGVKPATLAAWENDTRDPRANRVSMLAGLLNVSLRWLLTGEGEGLDAPVAARDVPDDMSGILTEMRQLQRDVIRCADRLGHLEKRLRLSVTQE